MKLLLSIFFLVLLGSAALPENNKKSSEPKTETRTQTAASNSDTTEWRMLDGKKVKVRRAKGEPKPRYLIYGRGGCRLPEPPKKTLKKSDKTEE